MIKQTYWRPHKTSKQASTPIWKQKNDDSELGGDENEKRDKESRKMQRENNKMARELGYARGVKQMKEEGAI